MNDMAQFTESASIIRQVEEEKFHWSARWSIEKYIGDWTGEQIASGIAPRPFDVIERNGNLLTASGVNMLWTLLAGSAGATFSNASAHLGVGACSLAAAVTQTDLQSGSTLRRGMEAGYPSLSTCTLTFRSVFGASDANWAWNEWGVFNHQAGSTMLNRKVESMGTKSDGSTWTLTVALSLT